MHDYQYADAKAIEPIIHYLLSEHFQIVSIKELIGEAKIKKMKVIYSQKKCIQNDGD